MLEWVKAMATSSWVAAWHPQPELRARLPAGNFHDSALEDLDAVTAAYRPYIAEGRWTLGLCDMW